MISFCLLFASLKFKINITGLKTLQNFKFNPIQTRDTGSAESGDSWSTVSVKGEWVTGKVFSNQVILFCLNLNLLPLNPPKADVWFAQYHLLLLGHDGLNWSFTEFHSRIDWFLFTVLGPWKQAHRDGWRTTRQAFFPCLPKLSSLTGTWTWSYSPLFEYLQVRRTSVLNYF